MPKKTVTVPGVSCAHCVATIERELGNVQGVISVAADEASKRVTVEWTDAGVDWERIRTHMDDIGYPPAEEA